MGRSLDEITEKGKTAHFFKQCDDGTLDRESLKDKRGLSSVLQNMNLIKVRTRGIGSTLKD